MAAERHAPINRTQAIARTCHSCYAPLGLHFVYLHRPTAQRLSSFWRVQVVSIIRGLADLYALIRQRHGEVVHCQLPRPLALLARLARAQPTHLLRVLGHVEYKALRGHRNETQPDDAHTVSGEREAGTHKTSVSMRVAAVEWSGVGGCRGCGVRGVLADSRVSSMSQPVVRSMDDTTSSGS